MKHGTPPAKVGNWEHNVALTREIFDAGNDEDTVRALLGQQGFSKIYVDTLLDYVVERWTSESNTTNEPDDD